MSIVPDLCHAVMSTFSSDASGAVFDGLRSAFGGGGSSSGGGGGGGGGGGFSGGSSSSSGSGDGEGSIWWFVVFVAVFIVIVVMGNKQEKARRKRKREREQGLWERFGKLVPGATEQTVEDNIKQWIVALNQAWSRNDVSTMTGMLTTEFHGKIAAVLEAMAALGRRNEVSSVVAGEIELVELHPATAGEPVRFRVDIGYSATDKLIGAAGEELASNASNVEEEWTFHFVDSTWRLAAIDPATRDERFDVAAIQAFAGMHGFHYSADFGRMLLPTDGVLFSDAAVETSDVNNHVIGHHRGQLVQFHTYVANPVGDPDKQVVVAQATLPKRYNDILVRRRRGIGWPTRDLREHSFESMAFNEQWRVHSHPDDDIATFELLDPAFLERMTELDHDIGIEAVDNFLYVFDEGGTAPYSLMLDLLDQSFDELRL